MLLPEQEILNNLVARVFRIEDVTLGDPKKGFITRYHGHLLLEDSAEAYDKLAESLRPYEITPLFRLEQGRQVIYLMAGVARPPRSNSMVSLLLFIVTLVSVLLTGALYDFQGPLPTDPLSLAKSILLNLYRGWPFAASMLGILTAHEFGHYLAGRYHKTAVSLPYFIPMPIISPLGTMGAFIQLKEPPKNRRILLDIAIAGPLAGLVVAVPVLLYGLSLSPVGPLSAPQGGLVTLKGNSILYLLAKFFVHGEWLPAPASYGGLPPILYWIRYFFTGQPIPLGGRDVLLNSVAWAGWAGLLVTAMNLIPAGQLDGGHILYVLLDKHMRKLLPYILVALVGLGFFWSGWWIWAVLLFTLGRAHAEPLDQITPLDPRRKALAALMLVIFVLVFIPVPLMAYG